jgi:type IV secretory pathway VirD2 relaxase
MLHGVDDRGQDLIIAREYIARGLRERATELVTVVWGRTLTRRSRRAGATISAKSG